MTCHVKIMWAQVLAWNMVQNAGTHGSNNICVFREAICVHYKAVNTKLNGKWHLCWQTSFTSSELQKESKACCFIKITNDNHYEALTCPAVESRCVSVWLSGDLRTMYLPTHRQKDWQIHWQTDCEQYIHVFSLLPNVVHNVHSSYVW